MTDKSLDQLQTQIDYTAAISAVRVQIQADYDQKLEKAELACKQKYANKYIERIFIWGFGIVASVTTGVVIQYLSKLLSFKQQ